MWRSSRFSCWLVDDMMLAILFAAATILNLWLALSLLQSLLVVRLLTEYTDGEPGTEVGKEVAGETLGQ